MTTRRKAWMIRPAKKPTSTLPDTLKAEVEAKSSDLIANVLKPKHVRPSPENERFNYITDIGTEMFQRIWHKSGVGLSNTLLVGKWQRGLPKL